MSSVQPKASSAPSRSPSSLPRPALSLGTKLSAATVALILLVTVGIYVGLSRYQRESLLVAKEQSAIGMVRLFADSCAAPVTFDDPKTVEQDIAMLAREKDVEYVGVWKVGEASAIGALFGELKRGPSQAPRSDASTLRVERLPERVVLTAPIRDLNGDMIAVTTVAFSLARENAAITDVRHRTLFVSALVGLGVSVLLTVLSRLLIIRPLAKLVLAAKRIEQGKEGNIDIHTRDEIGQLASAFRSMGHAIHSREERINARNRDMRVVLDNVGQGFITLDKDGSMLDERSRIVDSWFEPPEPRMKFADFLKRVDDNAGRWFALRWTEVQEGMLPLEVLIDQLPSLLRKPPLTFELTYRPVQQGEELDKLIVVITDISVRLQSEHAERAQREMLSIFRRALSDHHGLDGFFSEARALVAQLTQADDIDLDKIKRALHTLKGISASYDIESVATYCHQLEDRVAENTRPPNQEERKRLSELWGAIEAMRAELLPSGERLELDGGEYTDFLAGLERGIPHQELLKQARAWRYERATDRLHALAQQIEGVASRLGKRNVEVTVAPSTLRLPPQPWAPFWASFAHVTRNAVDHGVESDAERIAAGKPVVAQIRLGIELKGQEVVVSIADDGRGINWPRIAERAKQLGQPHATPADLERALFTDGVSSTTEITTISGRGIGLSAMREVMLKLGGSIEVQSRPGAGTTFRFHLPTTMLN